MPKESLGKVVRRRTQGVAFIAIVAALIGLSIAIYDKAFTSTVDVTLRMDHTGNQLQPDSDVKIRGLIVGSVDSVSSNGDQAIVKLHLDPDKVDEIPNNVTAQILPKTLFGEQYVALSSQDVAGSGGVAHIKGGETISQNRSKGALEAQTVLAHLYPLLTAVQPAQLNATLTALATALNGRGDKLGQTLVNLDNYLKTLNGPSSTGKTYTSQLVDDLDKLGKVATEYNGVAPDLLGSLNNLLTSARTVVEKRQSLDALLTAGSSAAVVLQGFLNDNKERIIAVSGQTQKVFGLLNQYSPEFSCLFTGISKLYDGVDKIIRNGAIQLSATPDITKSSPVTTYGPYKNGEQPKLVTGYGPNCFGLPDNPTPLDGQGNFQIPAKYKCLNDGAWLTLEASKGACSGSSAATSTSAIGSPAEDAMVDSLVANAMGTTPDKVSGSATLLAGPLLRGNKVVIK